jgi:C-terminal processing protease CtpA/Prc
LKGDETLAYSAPIRWDWIEDQLVITAILDNTLTTVRMGDIVSSLDGVKARQAYENQEQYVSAATEGWKRYRTLNELLQGPKDSNLSLTIIRDGKEHQITLPRSLTALQHHRGFQEDTAVYKKITEGIHYLNLAKISMAEINKLMPELEKARAIICDLRGYPNGNDGLINHLLKEKENSRWMGIPQVIYPDYQKVTYQWLGWDLEPVEPALTAKMVFIINGRAISYAESYIGYIEGFKLATIVGQPTAGTNGNVNTLTLPGGYTIRWTGMRVVKHDGSTHHGIGIIPDVRVERTIQGVKQGRDEFLEKALEIAEK